MSDGKVEEMFNRITSLVRMRGRAAAWAIAALLLTATVLTAGARTWLSAGPTAPSLLPAPVPQQEGTPAPERGLIRLLTSGFSPAEVSGQSGQYRLAVTRPSPDEEVILQLKRTSGELVQEITMPQGKLDWTTLIELQAGSYTLTVSGHPDWVCSITIQ